MSDVGKSASFTVSFIGQAAIGIEAGESLAADSGDATSLETDPLTDLAITMGIDWIGKTAAITV